MIKKGLIVDFRQLSCSVFYFFYEDGNFSLRNLSAVCHFKRDASTQQVTAQGLWVVAW